jgi:biotin carboxyl carrier protein
MEMENLESLNIDTSIYKTRLSKKYRSRKPHKAADPCLVYSFIPGTIVEILVVEGKKVKTGDGLVVLEAMKMKNLVKSAIDGTVKKITVKVGERVPRGSLLVELSV